MYCCYLTQNFCTRWVSSSIIYVQFDSFVYFVCCHQWSRLLCRLIRGRSDIFMSRSRICVHFACNFYDRKRETDKWKLVFYAFVTRVSSSTSTVAIRDHHTMFDSIAWIANNKRLNKQQWWPDITKCVCMRIRLHPIFASFENEKREAEQHIFFSFFYDLLFSFLFNLRAFHFIFVFSFVLQFDSSLLTVRTDGSQNRQAADP